jgi:FADH2 O2-dependent halogenase
MRAMRFVTSHEPRATSHVDADIALIGSGFAGSLTALCLRRLGHRVVMVERGRHPRFAIGESSTPLANLLLEELADRYDLPNIRAFSKWGTWQRARPDVAGGLKRGFTFYFHRFGEPFAEDREHARQLLVAASPHDEIGDTHWYRPDFDSNLVREAETAGAIYLDETELTGIEWHGDRATLEGTRHGQPLRVTASFVVDASGPRGFLVRALGLDAPPLTWLPPTQGLYTHFVDVERWDEVVRGAARDGAPPYPPDAAALHHVFPGGWIWMLRFNNGITSAGAALTDPVAASIDAFDGGPAWDRLLEKLPTVRDQFCRARPVHPWIHAPRIGFRTRQVCGPTWALLPSAAGVIDPLLSTGFPLTLLGIGRLVDLLERTAAGPQREAALRRYEQITLDELDVTERLVAALYSNMADVPLFKRLTLLYFAAASYSEAARRLGRGALAPGFLLCANARFGPELRACAGLAATAPTGAARHALLDRIDRAIEPFDIAGLLDRSRRDWYPVLAEDLVAGGSKLEATADEIDRLLERCGFASGTGQRSPR